MSNPTSELLKAFRFFQKHGSSIVGENARCALDLARAERDGEELGLVIDWSWDEHADWSWLDQDCIPRSVKEANHDVEQATVRLPCECCGEGGDILASIGGVFDADDNYRRVLGAELFAEALHALKEKRS